MSDSFDTSKDVTRLKALYFSDPGRRVTIQKGAVLLTEGKYNDRLFLVLDGCLAGFLKDENNELVEVFRSTANMFLGVYSFFSPEHRSYLTLIAEEQSTVAYIDQVAKDTSADGLASDFLPVIVHELYLRQLLAQRLTEQRQAAIKKLYEKEKMATLGQLAAGLAHELNNAIGVLDRNTDWIGSMASSLLKNKRLRQMFLSTMQEGQTLGTAVLRERRKNLEKRFGIPPSLAKQLAKTTLDEDEIRSLLKENKKELDSISVITEAGIVLHDMQVAAKHAAHVVHSVRILGLNDPGNISPTSLLETVNKALALTKTLLQDIAVSVHASTDGPIMANPGDLVQIWVNLIKNAGESLSSSETRDPTLMIIIEDGPDSYSVRISDNGPGIREEIMKKIFQPNFTTRVNGISFGLGLGLSIVKKIVNQYKGSVRVESKPGDTHFIVQLPKP